MCRFSIIVAAYNVVEYIDECLTSVINQAYKNYELIVIDDGSTDATRDIVDSYAFQNENIKPIHQKNRGLSAARNAGLDCASGEYILFLDGDDYIDSSTLTHLSELIDGGDSEIIATYRYYEVGFDGVIRVDPEKISFVSPKNEIFTGLQYLNMTMQAGCYHACAQYCVLKKEFVDLHKLRFENNILHEDELWTLQVLPKSQRVTINITPFYYHRMRQGSITNRKDYSKNSRDLVYICRKLDQCLPTSADYGWVRNHLAMLYMNAAYIGGIKLLTDMSLDRRFPLLNAKTIKNRLKSVLFYLSPEAYVLVDSVLKRL